MPQNFVEVPFPAVHFHNVRPKKCLVWANDSPGMLIDATTAKEFTHLMFAANQDECFTAARTLGAFNEVPIPRMHLAVLRALTSHMCVVVVFDAPWYTLQCACTCA